MRNVKAWPAALLKRWFAGVMFGLLANAGGLGVAFAVVALTMLLGSFLGWNEADRSDILMKTIWIWLPLGWFISAREIVTDESEHSVANFVRHLVRGDGSKE